MLLNFETVEGLAFLIKVGKEDLCGANLHRVELFITGVSPYDITDWAGYPRPCQVLDLLNKMDVVRVPTRVLSIYHDHGGLYIAGMSCSMPSDIILDKLTIRSNGKSLSEKWKQSWSSTKDPCRKQHVVEVWG
jgi:hypothetical protein